MGALLCVKSPTKSEPSTEAEKLDDKKVSLQDIIDEDTGTVQDGRDCKGTSETRGTSVGDESKGSEGKPASTDSRKQARATAVKSPIKNAKTARDRKLAQGASSVLPESVCAFDGQSKSPTAKERDVDRHELIREERGDVSRCISYV